MERGIKAADLQLARGQSVGKEEVCAKTSLEFLQESTRCCASSS